MQITVQDNKQAILSLRRVLKALGKNGRDMLEYARLEIKGNQVNIIATDAFVMIRETLQLATPHAIKGYHYVHYNEIKRIIKVLKDTSTVDVDAKTDIEYPDADRVIPNPEHYKHNVVVRTVDLVQALKISCLCLDAKHTSFAVKDGKIKVIVKDSHFENKSTFGSISFISPDKYFRFLFNPEYMLKLFDAKQDTVTIYYNQKEQPVMVNDNILMPVRGDG